uniref:Chromo domain-containing protein n=1 Tax=Elaeophora elaphi TaxID=1147741 RepID=A0A0R3S0J4_9BILA
MFQDTVSSTCFDQMDEEVMNSDSAKVDYVEEEINETNADERKSEDIGEDSNEDEELDEDEFEVDHILNVAAIDGEIKYQVRWKGYGSDEDSWEPEENLETARRILDEYIEKHQDEVKKAQDAIQSRNKLRKRCGNRMKLRNKGNKKLRRSSSSEYSETKKTVNVRTKKKMKMEYEDDYYKNDSDEEYKEVSKKRGRRTRAAHNKLERTKIADFPENEQNKPLSKDLSPKKAKNAWLYDDAEDIDSDVSEGSREAKKNDVFLRKTKEKNQLNENGATEKNNFSLATSEEQYESNLNEKIVVLPNEKKRKGKGEVRAKVIVYSQCYCVKLMISLDYEPKVEFTGVVQCHDGAVKVIYTKKGEKRAHVVSVKEAFEIDGFGLVQYFISRCEFGQPQSGDV